MKLDHVAISGETREAAQAYVEDALGVPLEPGGNHAVFHTHNALLGLEDGLYLEAIAINPNAPTPNRPRWFDLDRFRGAARLTNWICASSDLDKTLGMLGHEFGDPVSLERGDLRWRMAVPHDGILPFDGCAPALIQWDAGAHPATRLAPQGVRLRKLTISHPKAHALQVQLHAQMTDPRIEFETGSTGLNAEFDTPHGARWLSS